MVRRAKRWVRKTSVSTAAVEKLGSRREGAQHANTRGTGRCRDAILMSYASAPATGAAPSPPSGSGAVPTRSAHEPRGPSSTPDCPTNRCRDSAMIAARAIGPFGSTGLSAANDFQFAKTGSSCARAHSARSALVAKPSQQRRLHPLACVDLACSCRPQRADREFVIAMPGRPS
jgi:hypothetical protein